MCDGNCHQNKERVGKYWIFECQCRGIIRTICFRGYINSDQHDNETKLNQSSLAKYNSLRNKKTIERLDLK